MEKIYKRNAGYLKLVVGPMFSMKSTQIIDYIDKLKAKNIPTLVLSHISDDRYLKEHIVTHDKIKRPCIAISDLFQVLKNKDFENARVIIIEEAQFFSNLNKFVRKIVNEDKKEVVVSGLSGDFNMNPIGEIHYLYSFADEVLTCKSICEKCGEFASFTCKYSGNNNLVQVGGKNIYKPLCRECFMKNSTENVSIEEKDAISSFVLD